MALAEMLTTELQAGGELCTIPQDRISRMKRELSVTDVANPSRDAVERIGENLGTSTLVLGQVVPSA